MTMRTSVILAAAAFFAAALAAHAQQAYPTPEDAVKDLVDSAKTKAPGFGDRILGKEGAALLRSGDPDQDAENLKDFNEASAEITGIDELSAIAACRAYVQAQEEYRRLDRDGDGLREYAAKIISSPGKHDGLYWTAENQADISPLDDLVQDANLATRANAKPEPYNGYNFKILTAQGPAAPGGAHSYLINGHMIAGHAMVAWPAAWGDSGVQTFICGQDGVVRQKNLGPNTAKLGAAMFLYNPDSTWTPVE